MPDSFKLGGDLVVRRLGFGTVRLTGPGVWGPPADRRGGIRLLRAAVDAGVNFIDTADSYGPGATEELIAEALYPYASDLVIATKVGFAPSGPGKWERDCRPERLTRCCEESLRRLRLDCIDLYQLHVVDPAVPIEESLGALRDLQVQGLVRHIGVSNVTLEEVGRSQSHVQIASVQNRYNVVDRGFDPIVAECERVGAAFIPWYPLARGALAGPHATLDEIAACHRTTAAQIALAWLLHHSPVILPVPGTTDAAHLTSNLEAGGLTLTNDELAALDRLGHGSRPIEDGPMERSAPTWPGTSSAGAPSRRSANPS